MIIQHFDPQRNKWVDIAIPQAVIDALPPVQNSDQRQWNQLYREFVADVRGEGPTSYPTFRDGWVAAEVMDIVRHGSWTALPTDPGAGP